MIVLWDVDGQTVGVVPLLTTLGCFARLGILRSEKLISERSSVVLVDSPWSPP